MFAPMLRRLAEVANLMLDAGVILIVTAVELTREDQSIIETTVGRERMEVVWVGEGPTTDVSCDLLVPADGEEGEMVDAARRLLQERGIIFSP